MHINSLTPSESYQQKLDNLNYRYIDIGLLSYKNIIQTLNNLTPRLIITINFMSLIDVLLIRISKLYKYKILYIEHGSFDIEISMKYKKSNLVESFRRYITFTKLYLEYLFRSKKNISRELNIIYSSLVKRDFSKSSYDFGIYYCNYSIRMKNKILCIDRNNIFTSGYPITDSKKNYMQKFSNVSEARTVIYIHQPFILDRLSDIDRDGERKYIQCMLDLFIKYGYKFKIRLHPRENIDNYKDLLTNDVVIDDINNDLLTSLSKAEIIIGHHSTALFAGIILKKPIIITRFPGYCQSGLSYLGQACYDCSSLDDLDNLLNNNANLNPKNNHSFISEYIGEINYYEHKVDIIDRLISD